MNDVITMPHEHDGEECTSEVRITGSLNFNTLHFAQCIATDLDLEPWTT